VSTAAPPDIRVDVLLDSDEASLAEAVRAGLLGEPRQLPPRCLYDERGSELFDRITELPEYYPTRCERGILNRYAPEIVAETGAEELVEIGSGVASKTRALLYAMAGAGTLRRYVPFDVDSSVVQRSAEELTSLYPGLGVHGLVGDFTRHLSDVPAPSGRRLVAFLGGTIGNLGPGARAEILGGLRELLGEGDRLVLGVDLVKDEGVIVAAYDDSEGVTAEFTLNVLRVLNRDLGADFDLAAFSPFARWNAAESRVELGVRADSAESVTIGGLDSARVEFAPGDEIRTEISSKFTPERLERELKAAGLGLDRLLLDDEGLFSVALVVPLGGVAAGTRGGAAAATGVPGRTNGDAAARSEAGA
jgi:L-histidine Nalpha-methyltransferase